MFNKGNVHIRAISFLLALCLVLNVLLSSGIFSLAVFAEDTSNQTGTTQVLYVGGSKANDANDGKSEATALATVSAAYAKIPDDNVKTTIVICGKVNFANDAGIQTISPSSSPVNYFARGEGKHTHTGEVVFTSVYGDVDHQTDNSGTL